MNYSNTTVIHTTNKDMLIPDIPLSVKRMMISKAMKKLNISAEMIHHRLHQQVPVAIIEAVIIDKGYRHAETLDKIYSVTVPFGTTVSMSTEIIINSNVDFKD